MHLLLTEKHNFVQNVNLSEEKFFNGITKVVEHTSEGSEQLGE